MTNKQSEPRQCASLSKSGDCSISVSARARAQVCEDRTNHSAFYAGMHMREVLEGASPAEKVLLPFLTAFMKVLLPFIGFFVVSHLDSVDRNWLLYFALGCYIAHTHQSYRLLHLQSSALCCCSVSTHSPVMPNLIILGIVSGQHSNPLELLSPIILKRVNTLSARRDT